jgi:hypothetical protein
MPYVDWSGREVEDIEYTSLRDALPREYADREDEQVREAYLAQQEAALAAEMAENTRQRLADDVARREQGWPNAGYRR